MIRCAPAARKDSIFSESVRLLKEKENENNQLKMFFIGKESVKRKVQKKKFAIKQLNRAIINFIM